MRSRNKNNHGGFGSAHGNTKRIGTHATAHGVVHRVNGVGPQRRSGKNIEFLARQRDRAFERCSAGRLHVLDAEVADAEVRGVTESERNQFALRSAWLTDALAFGRRG